ncbi:MAG: MFS transporter [Deltaproteobacteria bacterium]|uniref:MFS transporter n=1 Tax=Candidatus Zymogenus saltonus TaxID=2844893 RepID=A0A9D8PSN5_9DELT|nr:MFS transporter [Candidatus Zymogenus saltonus]
MSEKTTSGAEAEFPVSRGYSYYVFTLLFLLYVFDYIDRMVVSSLFPFLIKDWGITTVQCSWLASIVTISMTIFVFPVSLLVDRWSRKKTIGLMAVLWSIAAGACALTKNFKQLLSLRSVIGIGEAAYTPGGHAMIAAYFPEERRATMNGYFTAAIPLGSALGVILGGQIAETIGWRYAFGLTAIPGLFVAILFFWVKDYKTAQIVKGKTEHFIPEDPATHEKMSFWEIVKEFAKTPSVIFTYLGYVGSTFVTTSLITFLPLYFHRIEGLDMFKAGTKTSVIFLLAIIGAPFGGFIADKWRKRRLNARMAFPAISSILTAIFLMIAFNYTEGQTQYIFLILFGFTAPMFASAGSAVTQDVVQPGLRAISYSLAQFFMMMLGYTLGPLFVGYMCSRFGNDFDLLPGFGLLPLFTLFGGVMFFIGSYYYVRDLKKVARVKLVEEKK